MFWDCIIDFTTASKMPEGLTKPATGAAKKPHGRRRVSCETDVTETTTCSFRGEVSATFTAIREEGNHVVRDESCLLRGATAFANDQKWEAEEHKNERSTVSPSRPCHAEQEKRGSYLHATPVILCTRSGRILVCSVPCNSSADLLVGATSPDHRTRNGAKSGRARSGETWSKSGESDAGSFDDRML